MYRDIFFKKRKEWKRSCAKIERKFVAARQKKLKLEDESMKQKVSFREEGK